MSTRSRSTTSSSNVHKTSGAQDIKGTAVRRRILKACNYCRQRKIKCNGNTPCLNCKSHDIQCEYSKTIRKRARQPIKKVTLQDLEKRMNQMDDKYSLVIGQLSQIMTLLKEKNIVNDIKTTAVSKKRGRKPKSLSSSNNVANISNEQQVKQEPLDPISEGISHNLNDKNEYNGEELSEDDDNDNDNEEYDYSEDMEDEEVLDGDEYEYSEDLELESPPDEQDAMVDVPYEEGLVQGEIIHSESLPISPVTSTGSSIDQKSDRWQSALTPNDNFSFNSMLENNFSYAKYAPQSQLAFNNMSTDLTNMENKLDLLYGEMVPTIRTPVVYDF